MAGQIGSGVRSNLDELVAEMLGDVLKLHDEIKALPPDLRESLAPSLGAIAQAMKDGQKSIDDYAKGQAPIIKGFATAELAGMRQAFSETSADLVAMVKKDLAEATHLHQSAVRQAGYREPWGPWHFILIALLVAGAVWGVYAGLGGLYEKGYSDGKTKGYSDAVEAKAAASWANTETGKLAYQLAKAGAIKTLAECSGKNWQKNEKERSCFGYGGGLGNGDGWFFAPKE
ncbi:MAG: hypothetical protein ACOYBY_16475 [Dermatophilaceae bacterium]